MIQADSPDLLSSRAGSGRLPWRAVVTAAALLLALGLTAGCSGGGGGGGNGGGSGSGGQFQDTGNAPDDRYLQGDPGSDGTGSVPHVEIVAPLPGADPALDVVGDRGDFGG